MQTLIVLSCEGRQDNGFVFCNGVDNSILNLDKQKYSDNYEQLIEYLTKISKLFDKATYAYNIISNTIYKIHELGYFNAKQYDFLVYFLNMHKRCGIKMEIVINDE